MLREDRACNEVKSKRKFPKKNVLPPAVVKIMEMVEQVELKVENEKKTTTRGSNKKLKGKELVKDLMLSRVEFQSELTEVSMEMIEKILLCLLCNHRSIVPLTKKEDVIYANKVILHNYELRVKEWESSGKKGIKPRAKGTESQILGCVCYMQNCIGSTNGNGCFSCKDLNGDVPTIPDTR